MQSAGHTAVRGIVGVVAVGVAMSFGASSASASLPIFDGDMRFAAIEGPSGPEEFSWEVELGAGQTLEQVDDQNAEVYYTHEHHPAFDIVAEVAHDAEGHVVPTSLVVSGLDVITLVVHHRAGNPAEGGEAFTYPVSAGPAFKIDEGTVIVDGPEDEQELREARERIEKANPMAVPFAPALCTVPRLHGMSLKDAKRTLRSAHCAVGEVRKLRSARAKNGKVIGQSQRPGKLLASEAEVDLKLGG